MPGSAINPFVQRTGQLDVIDVREYGVVADGSADDTDALQAALDAAPFPDGYAGLHGADLPATAVALPAGRCKITSPLQINSNTLLLGVGSGSSYIHNFGSGNTIELKTGSEVQVWLRDFAIVIQSSTALGIDFSQVSQISVLSDAAHVVENVIVVGGARAFWSSNNSELRISNLMAYRQTPASNDACVYLGGTDSMIDRVTVAQPQWVGGGIGGAGFRAGTSNSRFVNCKVFGGNANGSTEYQDSAFWLIGQRNQVFGVEVQDYPGWGVEDDQGGNSWFGTVVDSCSKGGANFASSFLPTFVSGAHFVNRGGVFTMPKALSIPNNVGTVVDCLVTSVAADFDSGQDGTGNFVTINGDLKP